MAKKKEALDKDTSKSSARKKAVTKKRAKVAAKPKVAAKRAPKAARAPKPPRTAAAPPAPQRPAATRQTITFGEPRTINHSQELEIVRAESSKFEIEPRERFVEPLAPGEERELPLEYGDTKIVLLVRDPEWVFAYWEISAATREQLGIPKGRHSKDMALRIYDVTGVDFDGTNAVSFFDVHINDYAVSWYVRMPEADRAYCADLGLFTEQGDFVRIARSNVVATPRKDVSWETDAEWMRVSEEYFKELFRLSGGFAVKEFAGSEMMLRSLAEMVTQRLASERWGGSKTK